MDGDGPCILTEKLTKDFELELASSLDEGARRFALAFSVFGVSHDRGWNKGQRERFLNHREDQSVMVTEAAWGVTLPEQDWEDEKEGMMIDAPKSVAFGYFQILRKET